MDVNSFPVCVFIFVVFLLHAHRERHNEVERANAMEVIKLVSFAGIVGLLGTSNILTTSFGTCQLYLETGK